MRRLGDCDRICVYFPATNLPPTRHQAMSIYRKLGVSSRSAAVTAAREVGILSV